MAHISPPRASSLGSVSAIASGGGNSRRNSARMRTPPIPSPPAPAPGIVERLERLSLGVSGSEQGLADPHNRDAVLRPRRGEELPDGPLITACNRRAAPTL
jgi:hypothetical protein